MSQALTVHRAWIAPLAIRARWIVPLLVVSVAALVLFFRLGDGSLADWDESIYAQVAKEMLETGDWLTTRYDRTFFFDKPPLAMWSEAILFQAFGFSEFLARTPSALAGVGTVLLAYLLGSAAYGRLTGLGAAAILLTAGGFLEYARFGTTDSLLTFFSLLAIYAYWRARQGEQRWWLLVGLAVGLTIMTKSAAVWFATFGIGFALLIDGEGRRRTSLPAIAGALGVCLLVALPWHAYMYAQHGQPFVDGYVGDQIFNRASGQLLNNRRDPDFYLTVLTHDFFPWVFLLPVGLLFGLVDRRSSWLSPTLTAMVIAAIALYSAVTTKFPWYIVLIYPAAALLISAFLTRGLTDRRLTLLLVGAAAVAAVAYVLVTHGFPAVVTGRAKVMILGLSVSAGIALVLWLRRRDLLMNSFGLVIAAFFMVASATTLVPLFSKTDGPVAVLARTVPRPTGADSGLLFVLLKDDDRPSATFYSDRKVIVASDAAHMAELLPPTQSVPAIFSKDALADISRTCVVEPISNIEGYVYVRLSRRVS